MPSIPLTANRVFVSQLLGYGHGYPLWVPEPDSHLSPEYRREGTRVGDVGVLTTEGGFDYIFNVCYSADHPINSRGVPEGHVAIDPSSLETSTNTFHNVDADFTSGIVKTTEVSGTLQASAPAADYVAASLNFNYKLDSSEGAVLVLPNGADRTQLRNPAPLLNVASKNVETWYHYVRHVRGRLISDDGLYLITGFDKSTSWGVAAFWGRSESAECSIKLAAKNTVSASVGLQYSWSKPDNVEARSGPSHKTDIPNQTNFLRGFRISRKRQFPRSRIKITAMEECKADSFPIYQKQPLTGQPSKQNSSNSEAPSGSTSSPSSVVPLDEIPSFPLIDIDATTFPAPNQEPYHPLTELSRALLDRNPQCDVTVLHDDIWCSAVKQGISHEDIVSYVLSTCKTIIIGSTITIECANLINPDEEHGAHEIDEAPRSEHDFQQVTIYDHDDRPQAELKSWRSLKGGKVVRPELDVLSAEGLDEYQLDDDSDSPKDFKDFDFRFHLGMLKHAIGEELCANISRWWNEEVDIFTTTMQLATVLSAKSAIGLLDRFNSILALKGPLPRVQYSFNNDEDDFMAVIDSSGSRIYSLPIPGSETFTTFFTTEDLSSDIDALVSRLNPLSAKWAIQLLKIELDMRYPEHERIARKQCMRALRRLVKHFQVLPPSLYLRDVIHEGENPVSGGGYADIWKGCYNGQAVCLKVLRNFMPQDRVNIAKKLFREAVVWNQLRHPNVLPFYGVYEVDNSPSSSLITPWMSNGNIMQYLKANPKYNRLTAINEIVAGLAYLHQFDPPIIHGDIKGANVLVTDQGHCCLADFGLARIIESERFGGTYTYSRGTARYLAPELIAPSDPPSDESGKFARDIYAFGCTVYEICIGQVPFAEYKSDALILNEVLSGRRPRRPVAMDSPAWDDIWHVIEQCWAQDFHSRPSVATLLQAVQMAMEKLGISSRQTKPWENSKCLTPPKYRVSKRPWKELSRLRDSLKKHRFTFVDRANVDK